MTLYNEIIFYNHFGNGDIFTAREFVRRLIKIYPEIKFKFAHPKDPALLEDIQGLEFCSLDDNCKTHQPVYIQGDTAYFNTWIGQHNKYVEPGIVCSLDNFVRLYNDNLSKLGLDFRFSGYDLFQYIPTIDYSSLDSIYIRRIDNFCTKNPQIVLISNGDVQSNQAENFNFDPVIERMCVDFPDCSFVATNPSSIIQPNLYNTTDIIRKENGSDLREISYLSLRCDIIIGRSSGAYVYAQVKENYLNPYKKFIAFTYATKGGHMAFFDVPAKRYWNDKLDYNLIKQVINE